MQQINNDDPLVLTIRRYFKDSSSYQEMHMMMNLCGYDMNYDMICTIMKYLIYRLNIYGVHELDIDNDAWKTEYAKTIQFIKEILTETDIIDTQIALTILPKLCKFVLDTQLKDYILPLFREFAKRFPNETKRIYKQQVVFKRYSV